MLKVHRAVDSTGRWPSPTKRSGEKRQGSPSRILGGQKRGLQYICSWTFSMFFFGGALEIPIGSCFVSSKWFLFGGGSTWAVQVNIWIVLGGSAFVHVWFLVFEMRGAITRVPSTYIEKCQWAAKADSSWKVANVLFGDHDVLWTIFCSAWMSG